MRTLSCIIALLLCLASCCKPHTESYQAFYSYRTPFPQEERFVETPYYVIFLVNARHLDYSSLPSFMKTCAKHPSDCSKNGDVGHAWIYLSGPEGVIEGGQSGETGLYQPRYFEGVLENSELGAENPVSYLWAPQSDGFFQCGSGGHRPTFAAKVDLSCDQYEKLKAFIYSYDFADYSLSSHQCTTFLKQAAALIDLHLDDQVLLEFPSTTTICGESCPLWRDPKYQCLPCGSPDKLEESLMSLVRSGSACNATCWYIKSHCKQRQESYMQTSSQFPSRLCRWWQL
ncbi:MAG: hypothetical protein ACK5MA_08400 [Parachlamydiaceae bacterium]